MLDINKAISLHEDLCFFQQVWDNIYFTLLIDNNCDRKKSNNNASKILEYFISFPKDKNKFHIDLGNYLRMAGVKRERCRKELTDIYRSFYVDYKKFDLKKFEECYKIILTDAKNFYDGGKND